MLDIKSKRLAHKMTQEELGKHIGAAQNTISQYESGERKPPYPVLKELALVFDCTVDDLIIDNPNTA